MLKIGKFWISITRANYCIPCLCRNVEVWLCMMKIWRKVSILTMKSFNMVELCLEFNWNSWRTWGFFVWSWVFFIRDDIFDRIQWTHQDKNISLKHLSNWSNENDAQCDAKKICDDKICKKKKTFINNTPKHNLYIKMQKIQ